MEKPHYKQPITADNIETALQFYCKDKMGFGFPPGGRNAVDKLVQQVVECPEISSMHDIETLLESDLQYIPKAFHGRGTNGQKHYYAGQINILDYILAANVPSWKLRHNVVTSRAIVGHIKLLKKQTGNKLSTSKSTTK